MRPAIAIVLLSLLLTACGDGGSGGASTPPARKAPKRECPPSIGHPEQVASAPSGTPSRVRLGPGMELEPTPANIAAGRGGRRLLVSGVVSGPDCAPLAGATLNVWQTNAAGKYGPGRTGSDRCCYLQGTVRTDTDGRYTLDTVMPRGYDGGPAHIHLEAGHPDVGGVVTELVFEDGGVPVRRGGDGRLRAAFDIVLPRQ
jgi:protocatechuate 3,4-dioxygenase beta subunit